MAFADAVRKTAITEHDHRAVKYQAAGYNCGDGELAR
jgi:hypothetical protein